MMKEQKGITLVALVITIIVMIILVGVTVTLALQEGGIFDTARSAAQDTNEAANAERNLSNGKVIIQENVDGTITNVEHNITDWQ